MLSISERSELKQAIFDELKNSIFSSLHVAEIGVITNVGSDNLITVKPIIRDRVIQPSGKTEWKEPPEISDTPYITVGTAEPEVGQSVLIIYCDKDFSAWVKEGGQNAAGTPAEQNQEIIRQHDVANAVAIVGFGVQQLAAGDDADVAGATALPAATIKMSKEPAFIKCVNKYKLQPYVHLLLALVAQESGDQSNAETRNDPMQAAEGAGLPSNAGALGRITREQSFEYGCKEFAGNLSGCKVSSPTDWPHIYIMLQSYNYGSGFTDYVNSHGGAWTQALANSFSDMQAAQNGWKSYGDKQYVSHVLRYDTDYFQFGQPGYKGSGSAASNGSWVWPTPSCKTVTSGWLAPRGSSKHHGLDIGAAYGAKIVASAAGTVSEAENDGGYGGGFGNHAYIKTGSVTAIYGHMSRCVVRSGQKVTAGQTIGYVGSTGHSTGPHLHFQIVVDGTWNNYGDSRNNPWHYLKK